MGIDGIGNRGPGAIPAPLPAAGAAATGAAQAPFQVNATAAPSEIAETPLARLERGEIGLDAYLDLRIEAATSHLAHLAPSDLAFIRDTLRAELGRDPALVELVRRTTGAVQVDTEP